MKSVTVCISIAGTPRHSRTGSRAASLDDAPQPYSHLPGTYMEGDVETSSNHRYPMDVESRSALYGPLLHFIACRVLSGADEADELVAVCLSKASVSAPHFDNEGAFRSWLVRLLIDEALPLLHERASERQSFPASRAS
jgi:hypothetical protein